MGGRAYVRTRLRRLFLAIPLALTLLLVLIVFVPVVPNPGSGVTNVCGPGGCVKMVQYDSMSYAYGGMGAIFQTGTNVYQVTQWMCSCPPQNLANCCVPPLVHVVWPIVDFLVLIDLLSIGVILLAFRSSHVN